MTTTPAPAARPTDLTHPSGRSRSPRPPRQRLTPSLRGQRRPDPLPAPRPSSRRRTALAVTGVLACALPTVFTVSLTGMLLTGAEPDHRFHQMTGQGLVLTALWLGSLLPLLRSGWAGRAPAGATGAMHLLFVAVGAACSVVAPGGGAPALMAVAAVTGALVWLALPRRPRLREGGVRLDPFLAPVALLAAAFWTPYALDQLALQNAAVGHHAQNPHYFDMAWMTLTLVGLTALASVLPAARRLALWAAAGSLAVAAAGLAFTPDTGWSLLAGALGLATAAAGLRPRRELGGETPGETR